MPKYFSPALGLSLLLSITAHARPISEPAGWSGAINLNLGYSNSQNQFSTDDDNQITNDLNNSGKTINSALLFPLLTINYTTADLRNQFFLGNSRENLGRAQFQYELGYRRMLSQRSKLTLAYFPELPLLNETWSDPYLTNVARQETEENYQGGRLRYEAIGDSPVTLEYIYAKRTIDKETSGHALFGANSTQAQALRREADLHRIIAEGFVPLSKTWTFTPALAYTTAKAQGSANDFNQYALRLNGLYRSGQHLLNLNAEYSYTKYSASNPVFANQTQQDDSYSLFALYVYNQPFAWKNAFFNIIAGYSQSDSNISFYDSKGSIAAFGFGYNF
ncbi:DUF2860 family protein [Agarivorans gilvus]|jgi:hypothetical protein|uniref:DUF2860 domain-containing protein n=1 Tax=Agarivorans gilvus TaxID=680279 RepID=A0ABQ1I3J6_9ALTE|nr:DUF2860 family protein [Agarivorans gilvus]GGB13177.1 hypothetical protein GCM10007414_28130 [Agarivorans gilvus]